MPGERDRPGGEDVLGGGDDAPAWADRYFAAADVVDARVCR